MSTEPNTVTVSQEDAGLPMSPKWDPEKLAAEQAALRELETLPLGKRSWGYIKRTGPGLLQSAMTLGAGSATASVLAGASFGYKLLWVQPLAMFFGVMMLGALSNVVLTRGERPYESFGKRVWKPLVFLWALGTILSSVIWHFPQYALLAGAGRDLATMGGLGVMTFASLIALAVNHHLKATQKLLTANELGTTKLGEIKGVLTVVIATAFTIEGITFVALFPGLYKVNHGNVRHTLWESLFFAVMAYNNAGFTPDGAGLHVNNWAVGLPILVSAFCGTLGFPVLLNLMRSWRNHRPPKRWSLHTKLTLTTTFCIVLASFTWFLLMEWNNKLLFATEGVEPRLWHAMVAAVMPRSSGFDLSWMPGVSDATKVFLSIVMFIGGGSTSTAGGIRVTTFAVILLTCRAAFTGRHDVNAFHRRIHSQAVMTAVAVTTSCLMLVTVVSMALMAITGCSLSNALFDTCSAFGLGGYSVGVASASSPAVLYILAATMFIGRLGPLTIAYAISRPRNVEPVRYPTEQIVVG